jgi:hypothetical protein
METIKSYIADFNDIDDDGLVAVLPGWGGSPFVPRADETVELVDIDNNRCFGIVDHVDPANALIYVLPIWESWEDAPPRIDFPVEELLKSLMRNPTKSKSDALPA